MMQYGWRDPEKLVTLRLKSTGYWTSSKPFNSLPASNNLVIMSNAGSLITSSLPQVFLFLIILCFDI